MKPESVMDIFGIIFDPGEMARQEAIALCGTSPRIVNPGHKHYGQTVEPVECLEDDRKVRVKLPDGCFAWVSMKELE